MYITNCCGGVCVAVRTLERIVSHKPTHGTGGGYGCRRQEKGGREDRVCTTAKSCDLTTPAARFKVQRVQKYCTFTRVCTCVASLQALQTVSSNDVKKWTLGDEEGTTHTCRGLRRCSRLLLRLHRLKRHSNRAGTEGKAAAKGWTPSTLCTWGIWIRIPPWRTWRSSSMSYSYRSALETTGEP